MFDSFKFLFEIFFVCSAFSSVSGTVKVKLMSRSLAVKNFEILFFFDRLKLEFSLKNLFTKLLFYRALQKKINLILIGLINLESIKRTVKVEGGGLEPTST